jgi:hypothetical protein
MTSDVYILNIFDEKKYQITFLQNCQENLIFFHQSKKSTIIVLSRTDTPYTSQY